MASVLKKVFIAMGALVLIGILLFAALIAFVVIGDRKAKEKATALCAPALVGTPAEVALERARKSGSSTRDIRWRKVEGEDDELIVAFPAALPLTGYMCSVSARDGVVIATNITTVD